VQLNVPKREFIVPGIEPHTPYFWRVDSRARGVIICIFG
jgi:hypothetical protein